MWGGGWGGGGKARLYTGSFFPEKIVHIHHCHCTQNNIHIYVHDSAILSSSNSQSRNMSVSLSEIVEEKKCPCCIFNIRNYLREKSRNMDIFTYQHSNKTKWGGGGGRVGGGGTSALCPTTKQQRKRFAPATQKKTSHKPTATRRKMIRTEHCSL